VSTERVLIRSKWRWYLLHRIVYCSHITSITLFYQLRGRRPPNVGGPWL